MKGWEFRKLCWRVQRELRKNRKPIILLFGNGYESQILLGALLLLKKAFLVVHVTHNLKKRIRQNASENNVKKIVHRFKLPLLILRPLEAEKEYKTFTFSKDRKTVTPDELDIGFNARDYLVVAGFKLSEPNLVKSYEEGCFDMMYCPLLRYPDEYIQEIYQDMKDAERFGNFLHENMTSDSHHNITVL